MLNQSKTSIYSYPLKQPWAMASRVNDLDIDQNNYDQLLAYWSWEQASIIRAQYTK